MNRPDRKSLIIFFIALLLQLAAIYIAATPIEKDAELYDIMANHMLLGNGFSSDGVNPQTGDIKQGYVIFLAIVYAFFNCSIFAVKIVQAILMAFTCVITYKIGKLVFNERVGYYSSLLTSIHPVILIISSHIVSESLFMFLLALGMLYMMKGVKGGSMRSYVLCGLFLALSTQVRFTTVFFPLLALIGLMLFYKNKAYAVKAGAVMILIAIVVMLPWSIRNYAVFGRINPFAEYGGVLWLGSYVKGGAHQDDPEVKRALSEINYYANKSAVEGGPDAVKKLAMERQVTLLRMGIENIKKDPFGYIALFPKKIFRLWIGTYSGYYSVETPFADFIRNRSLIAEKPFTFLWKLYSWVFSVAVFCFGLIGMAINIRRWPDAMPLYLILGYFTFLHMVTFANTGMSIPVVPYMIIFGMAALFFTDPGRLKRKCSV